MRWEGSHARLPSFIFREKHENVRGNLAKVGSPPSLLVVKNNPWAFLTHVGLGAPTECILCSS